MAELSLKILLVDDFEIVRMMLRGALIELGYDRIDDVEDGKLAVDKLREAHGKGEPYNLVFCDWNMPNMSGLDVLEYCRKTSEFKELPIVMVTAESESAQVVRAIRAGATDYLVKPIAQDVLEKKVMKIIGKLSGKAA